MSGLPQSLHLDNAAEFRSRALRSGCQQYGIEVMYRPVRRPNFGGHVERMNRTLMDRLRGLPGATVSIAARRKGLVKPPEKTARMSLREFERWLALEVGQIYHHSEHRGLMGAEPAGVWQLLNEAHPVRTLPGDPSKQMRFLISFLPILWRTIQPDGLTLFYLRYWHPVFAAWRELHARVMVRYHPEDLSMVFVSQDGKDYVQVPFADLRRPRISLWEQRAARKALKAAGTPDVSEALIFRTIEQQRQIVAHANAKARAASQPRSASGRQARAPTKASTPTPTWQQAWQSHPPGVPDAPAVNYDQQPEDSDVELWERPSGAPQAPG